MSAKTEAEPTVAPKTANASPQLQYTRQEQVDHNTLDIEISYTLKHDAISLASVWDAEKHF